MAYGIGQEIEDLTELGVDELTRRQSINPQLKYALALQEATNLVNAAAREREMAMEQPQPPQVIGQLEQGLAERLMPGVNQMVQQQPQPQPMMEQGISGVPAPNMMMAGGGIVSFAEGGIPIGNNQPIPNLMDKYGSEMVTGFLEGEKQLREEAKYVAPEYADAYKQKRDNFYSHYPIEFIQELYETRKGSIGMEEEVSMAGGGTVSFAEGGEVEEPLVPISWLERFLDTLFPPKSDVEKEAFENRPRPGSDEWRERQYISSGGIPTPQMQSEDAKRFRERMEGMGPTREEMAGGGTVSFAGPQGSFVGRNNPYNIRDYNQGWDGQTGATKGFVDFENEAAGVRAADKLLENYQSLHDISTVREVVARFAPPNENVTEEYIAFVSDRTGFTPDQPIDLGDPQTRNALLGAMGKIESGYDFDENILAQTDRAREDAANEAQQADAEAEINLLNAATQTDDGRGIADQARRAAESARRTIAARETEDTGGIGGALRRLLGQTDAKSAALSVPENETGIAAQARRAAEREGDSSLLDRVRQLDPRTLGGPVTGPDRSGYSIDGIKEALVNLLDLGPRERGAETFTDAAGNEYPTNPTDAQRMRQTFPQLAARSDAQQQADADAEVGLLSAAQGRVDDNRARIQSIMDLPSAQEADAEAEINLLNAAAQSPDTSGIGGAGTAPSAEIEDTAATNERSIRDRILGAINPELASDYATVPTPSEQQNMQRRALQEERRALIDQQRQYSPFGDEKVIYDAIQTKINGMTAQINAMQRRDIGGAQRIAEEEYEEQSNTNRILRELGLEEAIVELPNPYGTQVSETISDAPVDPVEEILTSSTNEVIDDGTSLVEETVTEELTPEAREFAKMFPGAKSAVDRYTITNQRDPEPSVSQPQSAVSSVQDRYDQLTTPQSGSEAFFDLLKTLGGGGGRSEGYEFSGIAERGAENRAARSKEAMDIIDAENRLRAIEAQNQTDQRTFIANYQQANAGKGTPAELYIEGAQLYLTARSIYSGNVSQTQEFYNIFESLKKDFQNPMNRAYQDAIREHGADSPQADAARANLFREATQILSAGVGAAEAAGV